MGIPKEFNNIIQRHLKVNAAWLPITNNYKLGDYGIIADGVFTKMGNIQEFNVSFASDTGPSASIDFTSADTRVVKFAAGAQVDAIPPGAIDARITFKFQNERSFMVKAPQISVTEIQNVNQVANQLKSTKGWHRKWKVVFQTYHAIDAAIISTIAADTEVSFSGDATALRELKLGSASLDFSSSKELGLEVHGEPGIIGLGLFKLKLIGGGPTFLTEEEKQGEAQVEKLIGETPAEDDL